MQVKLKSVVKVSGQWRQPGELVEVSVEEAQRLNKIGAASAADGASVTAEQDDLAAMRAELARLQEFERQQLAAQAEAELKAVEETAAKAKGKAAAKGDADGQANGK